jgi:hypothetical protein
MIVKNYTDLIAVCKLLDIEILCFVEEDIGCTFRLSQFENPLHATNWLRKTAADFGLKLEVNTDTDIGMLTKTE